jgi:hypothetical protein
MSRVSQGNPLRMKPAVWIAIVFVVLILGAVVLSTPRTQRFRCRICISFKGRRDCRTASAETAMGAQSAAIMNACAQLAGGVTESNQCENTPPESVEWLR